MAVQHCMISNLYYSTLETAPSLSHAFSRAANMSSDLISPQDPLHVGLKKFADAQERMGNARINQDGQANLKFYGPFLHFIQNSIDAANVNVNNTYFRNLEKRFNQCVLLMMHLEQK